MSNHELTDRDFLNALAKLIKEVDLGSPDEIDAELRTLGYDPESLGNKMESIAKELLDKSPHNWRNKGQELEEKREKIDSSVSGPFSQTRDDIIAAIQRLREQLGEVTLVTAHYRNFEDVPDEDLSSLLAEMEFLAKEQNMTNDSADE